MSTGHLVQASGATTTTGLRRIDDLVERGLVERQRDPTDGRRTMLTLAPGLRGKLEALVDRLAEHPGCLEIT